MARHVFGGTTADLIVSIGTGNEALLAPAATVAVYLAQSGGSAVTDLTDMAGAAIAGGVLTADATGAIPQFKGPDGTTELWAVPTAGGPRRLLVATDLAGQVATLDGQLNTAGTGLAPRLTAAESGIDALDTQVNTASTGIADRVTAAESDIDGFDTQLNTPSTGIAARMTAAEADINALESDVSGLDSQVNTAVTGIAARLTAAESDIDSLQAAGGGNAWEVKVSGFTDTAVQTAITAALSAPVGAAVQKRVIFPPGVYTCTTPWPLGTGGGQRENLQIVGAGRSTTTVNWSNSSLPMINITSTRYRWFKLTDMTINSTNALNVFCYALSQQTGGYNQGWILQDLHFTGTWTRGIGLDGGTSGNLNSEMTLNRVYTAASSVWSDAFFVSGLTNDATENQFLNYLIINCCLSLSSGTLFRFNRGGRITMLNGSHSANSTSNTITFLSFPPGQSNNPDRNHVLIMGVRFEPKGSAHKILDVHWADGAVTFISCSDSGSSQNSGSYTHERYTVTGNAIWSGNVSVIVRFQDCMMGGFVRYTGGAQTKGGIIFDGCKWYRGDLGQKADEIQGGTDPMLQWASGAPHYRFTNGWNYDDLSSWTVT